jgi:hypothetical protein
MSLKKFQNLIPEHLHVEEMRVLNKLTEFDLFMQKTDQKPNHVLRYIGEYQVICNDKRNLEVKLVSVPSDTAWVDWKAIFPDHTERRPTNCNSRRRRRISSNGKRCWRYFKVVG